MNKAETIGSAIALAPDTALWRVSEFDAFLLVFLVGALFIQLFGIPCGYYRLNDKTRSRQPVADYHTPKMSHNE